jgi:quercetin dioxygenase-like cupin family protein
MKKAALLVALGLMVSSYAYSDDVCSVSPKNCKILKETDKIRVIEFTAEKGDTLSMHSHPTMVVYILEAGKTRFTLEDGTTRVMESKAGEVLINPPVTHSQEHLSNARALLVEIKE